MIQEPGDKELRLKMNKTFGEPQFVANPSDGRPDPFRSYIVPYAKIDKIIAVKRYRDISSFGEDDGEKFTGETEEFVLDTLHVDKKVYQMLVDHWMIEN